MKNMIVSLFFILAPIFIYSIEVGGHLTEDTTWTPNNNPYLVTETLYVDAGVTLTILPGTEIKVSGASCTNWQEQSQNFWLYNGVSIAKMIWVDGRVIAEGTTQDCITFTRLQNENDFYWGCIYLSPQSDMSYFQYCKFEYTAGIGIALSNIAYAAISIYNGEGFIKNCLFFNNAGSLLTHNSLVKKLEISSNIFEIDNNVSNFIIELWVINLNISKSQEGFKSALVINNEFNNCIISSKDLIFINNQCSASDIYIGSSGLRSYFVSNNFIDSYRAISGGSQGDSLYIKNNHFIGGSDGIDIDDAYIEISDNYFEECNLSGPSEVELIGIVKNNIILNTNHALSGRFEEIYNNIFFNCDIISSVIGSSNTFINNLMVNNIELCDLLADIPIIQNNILINNDIDNIEILNNPIFRNCIIDFPLDPPLIDGGGNIIVDTLQAQSLFEDILNGDFHLIEGSLAIDAGFDTLGYYYPFDMEYNHRVWDGDNNGSAIVDIGPYEYGSPALGGIEGYTFNPTTGELIDYVLLKINNEPGEFTFSSGLGYFQYKLPAGIYDIYAERVFYEDVIEYQVEVIDGQFTNLFIPMNETVNIAENEIIQLASNFNLTNYPNPFNPETKIVFDLPESGQMKLEIYNIKGQKVKTLLDCYMSPGRSEMLWNSKDDNEKSVSSGIYFYRLQTPSKTLTKKMLLLK